MASDHAKPKAGTTGTPSPPSWRLPVRRNQPRAPIPVLIQNLSMGGVTLAVPAPWGISDWDHYRGKDCILRMADPGGQEVVTINGKISWTKIGDPGQPPLSLGVRMAPAPRGDAQTVERSPIPHLPGYQGTLGPI